MAVCKLAVLTYRYREEVGGYSIGDLRDCIDQARLNKEWGLDHIAYVRIDSLGNFIRWAKHKIKVMKRLRITNMPYPPEVWGN